jgi:hypothetical protein
MVLARGQQLGVGHEHVAGEAAARPEVGSDRGQRGQPVIVSGEVEHRAEGDGHQREPPLEASRAQVAQVQLHPVGEARGRQPAARAVQHRRRDVHAHTPARRRRAGCEHAGGTAAELEHGAAGVNRQRRVERHVLLADLGGRDVVEVRLPGVGIRDPATIGRPGHIAAVDATAAAAGSSGTTW